MTQATSSTLSSEEVRELMQFTPDHAPRAYANAYVRFHHPFTLEQRMEAAEKVGWNVFQFPSEMLQGGDLLSDSGTTTLTLEQLSAMLLGDEAYGSNWGYFQLIEQFEETFGLEKSTYEMFLFHQCRAAEHALFTHLANVCEDASVPSNGHFDTTRANIEANGMEAVDLFSPYLYAHTSHPFKGDIDLDALEKLLTERKGQIPIVFMTITNNTGGGQPVSLENLKAVRSLCDEHRLPFFLDACRFAENAWFIKHREEGCKHLSIMEIVHEVFSLCDGFTISLKKDGLSNMGGALVIKNDSVLTRTLPHLLNDLRDHQILVEGHPTYGGISGRDIMVNVEGLRTATTDEYLQSRCSQVHAFGAMLKERGVPVLEPFGGHAIYIDVDTFFEGTGKKREDFGGIALTGLLLLKGIRLCELGAFAFGTFDPKTGTDTFPSQNYVRCAVPRNKYEEQDFLFVADCIGELYNNRDAIPRAECVYGRELSLRHFKARFAFSKGTMN